MSKLLLSWSVHILFIPLLLKDLEIEWKWKKSVSFFLSFCPKRVKFVNLPNQSTLTELCSYRKIN